MATTTLRLRTLVNAPIGASLGTRARAEWIGGRRDTALSNRVALVVARANASAPTVPLNITPSTGTPTTIFKATYDGFASNERVSLWYDQPDGQTVGLGETLADSQGRISVSLPATELKGGRYVLVAFGQYSQASATGTFTVDRS